MLLGILIPFLMGAIGVLQNTLNRQNAGSLGLSWALLVNGCVVFLCCALLFGLLRWLPEESLPAMYRPLGQPRPFRLTDLIPGIFGFVIISTLPWAIQRFGATKVFISVIAAQLLVSLLWDLTVEQLPASAWRIAGCALALLGTVLAAF